MKKVKFVQPIPFGKKLASSNIKIDEKGNIWIEIEGKQQAWCLKDILSANRQLVHILELYEGTLWGLEAVSNRVSDYIRTLDQDQTKYGSKVSAIDLLKELEKEKDRIKKMESVIEATLQLIQEELERCEDVLEFNRNCWINIYGILLEFPQEKWRIKWNDFFYGLRKLRTVKVNPYKERVLSREVKDVEKVFSLVKRGELKRAKRILWKASLKLLPLCPKEKEVIWKIGKKEYVIREGKIRKIVLRKEG